MSASSIRNRDIKSRRPHRHHSRNDAAKGGSALYFVYEHNSFDELSNAVLEAAAEGNEHVHSLATMESRL